jgi:hypothetical protein
MLYATLAGGGISIANTVAGTYLEVAECVVDSCYTTSNGGGISARVTALTIGDTCVNSCTAPGRGAFFYASWSAADDACVIRLNETTVRGCFTPQGGIDGASWDPTAAIAVNFSEMSGGIGAIVRSSALGVADRAVVYSFLYTTLYKCSGTATGIYVKGPGPDSWIVNYATVVGNNFPGGLFWCANSGRITITNTLFKDNAGVILQAQDSGRFVVKFCGWFDTPMPSDAQLYSAGAGATEGNDGLAIGLTIGSLDALSVSCDQVNLAQI